MCVQQTYLFLIRDMGDAVGKHKWARFYYFYCTRFHNEFFQSVVFVQHQPIALELIFTFMWPQREVPSTTTTTTIDNISFVIAFKLR